MVCDSNEVVRLKEKGKSFAFEEIALQLRVSSATVYRRLLQPRAWSKPRPLKVSRREATQNDIGLILKQGANKRTVDVHNTAAASAEAQPLKPVRQQADVQRGRTHQSGDGLLAETHDERYRRGLVAKVCQQREKPHEAFHWN